jgi:hypothetical protein
MNLTAQFFISKLDIARLQRVKFPIRVLTLLVILFASRVMAVRSSGFSMGPSLCMFRNITGLPCPFCGTTRSVGNILLGNFNDALNLNPLGYFSLAFLLVLFISPSTIKGSSLYLAKKWWKLSQRNQILLTVSLLATTWIFNLPRLV